MTTRYKTRAIVFRRENVNEADRNFSVFTDDFGQLDIFAKAIRKIVSKLRNGIDIFFLSEIEFIQGKSRKTLTDANTIKRFDNILSDPERFNIATDIGEVMGVFIKGQEQDQELFNLLEESFCKLDDNNYSMNVPIPHDQDGRIGRECPARRRDGAPAGARVFPIDLGIDDAVQPHRGGAPPSAFHPQGAGYSDRS